MYCKINNYGMTINPDGNVVVCCSNDRDWSLGHISEIDDLNEHWKHHPDMIKLRNDDVETMNKACEYCLRVSKTTHSRWHNLNESYQHDHIRNDGEIRFLEFTTSNICNQTCVTCSSYFSSKWRNLEEELLDLGFLQEAKIHGGTGFGTYGHPISRIEGKNLDKIIKLLPQLDEIYVKGGEPFADKNNFTIIEELLKKNPDCKISITTNLSKIPQDFIDLFKKYGGRPYLSVSMDGVYDVYEYIRSTPFEQTVNNIKHWYSETGKRVNVGTYYSIYSIYNIKDVLDFFANNLLTEVNKVIFHKWITSPHYVSPQRVLFEKELDELREIVLGQEVMQYFFENQDKFRNLNLHNLEKLGGFTNTKIYRKQFYQYTTWLNLTRGIDIYEHIPQLKGIR